jgi:hypothetical protein
MKKTAWSTKRGLDRGASGEVERRSKKEEEGRGERRDREGRERGGGAGSRLLLLYERMKG